MAKRGGKKLNSKKPGGPREAGETAWGKTAGELVRERSSVIQGEKPEDGRRQPRPKRESSHQGEKRWQRIIRFLVMRKLERFCNVENGTLRKMRQKRRGRRGGFLEG